MSCKYVRTCWAVPAATCEPDLPTDMSSQVSGPTTGRTFCCQSVSQPWAHITRLIPASLRHHGRLAASSVPSSRRLAQGGTEIFSPIWYLLYLPSWYQIGLGTRLDYDIRIDIRDGHRPAGTDRPPAGLTFLSPAAGLAFRGPAGRRPATGLGYLGGVVFF